jgi:HK97 family phage major capsid protein
MESALKEYIDKKFEELADVVNQPVRTQATVTPSAHYDASLFAKVALTRAAKALNLNVDEYWHRLTGTRFEPWVIAGEVDFSKVALQTSFAQSTLAPELGGNLVFPDFSGLQVDAFLRPVSVVRRNVQNVVQSERPIPFARVSEGVNFKAFGEGQPIPATGYKTEVFTLTPKKLGGLVSLTSESVAAPVVGVLQMLQNDMQSEMQKVQDYMMLLGTGTQHEPKGLRNWSGTDIAANGTINVDNTIRDLTKVILALRSANIPMAKPVWFISPRTEHFLVNLNNGVLYIFKEEMLQQKKILGIPYEVTTLIPENLGAGNDESFVILADMSYAVIVDSPTVDFKVSSEASYTDGSQIFSAFQNDLLLVRMFTKVDFGVRHPKAVATLTGVKWGA